MTLGFIHISHCWTQWYILHVCWDYVSEPQHLVFQLNKHDNMAVFACTLYWNAAPSIWQHANIHNWSLPKLMQTTLNREIYWNQHTVRQLCLSALPQDIRTSLARNQWIMQLDNRYWLYRFRDCMNFSVLEWIILISSYIFFHNEHPSLKQELCGWYFSTEATAQQGWSILFFATSAKPSSEGTLNKNQRMYFIGVVIIKGWKDPLCAEHGSYYVFALLRACRAPEEKKLLIW